MTQVTYTAEELRNAVQAVNDRTPCPNDPTPQPIDQCAVRSILDAVLLGVAGRAWDEGHSARQVREGDDCECDARHEGECGCGRYGTGRLITPNPYRA